MPIYFTAEYSGMPLCAQSVGNNWLQVEVERPHGSEYYHWLQTENGSGTIFINENTLRLPPKTGILIAPFVPHKYKSENGQWATSFATFYGTLSQDIAKIVGTQDYILAKDTSEFSFQEWTDKITLLFEKNSYTLPQLSMECYNFLTHISAFKETQTDINSPPYLNFVLPTLKSIEKNYALDLNLQGLARDVFITPQYLSRLFRKYVNTSVGDYITRIRIKNAKEFLLNRPELSVKTVATMVGMSTVSHFIATFKAQTGYTPSVFRALNI